MLKTTSNVVEFEFRLRYIPKKTTVKYEITRLSLGGLIRFLCLYVCLPLSVCAFVCVRTFIFVQESGAGRLSEVARFDFLLPRKLGPRK